VFGSSGRTEYAPVTAVRLNPVSSTIGGTNRPNRPNRPNAIFDWL
jgi:hypothetical protein